MIFPVLWGWNRNTKELNESMKKNPPFRHFLSIMFVISRLRCDGWWWRMTDGGMHGEEQVSHVGRPQWLTAREQKFTGREHRPAAVTAGIRHPSPQSVTTYLPDYQTLSRLWRMWRIFTEIWHCSSGTVPQSYAIWLLRHFTPANRRSRIFRWVV